MQNYNQALANKLDLSPHLEKLSSFLAREKSLFFQGDRAVFANILKELESISLSPLPQLPNLDSQILHLQKYGTLKLNEIYDLSKLLAYFVYLQKLDLSESAALNAMISRIKIPENIIFITNIFDEKGNFKQGIYEEIDSLQLSIKNIKSSVDSALNRLLHSQNLAPFLVDNAIHFVNHYECLLLKSGYKHAISGMVIERSNSGFFYILPDEIITLKERQNALLDSLQEKMYEICKSICEVLHKHWAFFRFINGEFDKLDCIYARSAFAKAYDLSFITSLSKNNEIILKDFCHPILKNPTPINLHFSKQILMITGVNAGGKTMLLKSILGASLMAKFLIPFKCNESISKIPHFKSIIAIIADPQNVKNDISTFAGRMLEVSKTLDSKNILIGIDEVELGTDADEAASLYKVILEYMITQQNSVVLTTHHKNLAAIMANNNQVELLAALYDIKEQKPTFNFLQGSIGKSYAFESALRYGIPLSIIESAKIAYGKDKQRLNELIEKTSEVERNLALKGKELESKIAIYESKIANANEFIESKNKEIQSFKAKLESSYNEAKMTLKNALKHIEDSKQIHKAFNKANEILDSAPKLESKLLNKKTFAINDRVKCKNLNGTITAIQNEIYFITCDNGIKLKANLSEIEHSSVKNLSKKLNSRISYSKPTSALASLDLHGKRGDEAIELLDVFLSNAILAGYDSVLVYHGIGSGILSKLIKQYLLNHPKIASFEDAPANQGGFGAKIIKL